jgi:hypothetical protein
MKNILWSLVFFLFTAGICSAQSVVYLPQFVDGLQSSTVLWGTAIAVTNLAGLGTPAASGTITLTKDDGTAMNLAFTDENGHPSGSSFQLAGGQTAFFISPTLSGAGSPGPLVSGFATVASNLPVTAGLIFFEGGPNGTIGEAGVPAALPLTRQATFISKTNKENTGVAVANPGTVAATLTFQLLDKSGTPVGTSVNRPLQPSNHTSFFVTDLFPSATSGTLRITSDQPIVSTALYFRTDGTFATFPIFPLP